MPKEGQLVVMYELETEGKEKNRGGRIRSGFCAWLQPESRAESSF